MSLEARLSRLEAQHPPPAPPQPCPQQAAWLESLPDAEQAAVLEALLLPAAHPARDQWAAAFRDWLAGLAATEHAEDAQRAAGYYAWQYDPGDGLTWGEPYRPLAEIWATLRQHRRACWPKYFACQEETCACWQWVQAQPAAPPDPSWVPGAGG